MEFKGTKGKWILNYNGGGICQNMLQIINNDGCEVCNFGDDEQYYPSAGTEPNEYDALLISKAPEMLEMLKDIKDYLGSDKRMEVEQLIKEATEL